MNGGTGAFTAHPAAPAFGGGSSTGVALGDLDGDGDLDAVVANINGQAETVWVNDGTGVFTAHPTAPAFGAGDSFGVALGDLDVDGDLDAVVANRSGEPETVWLNGGTGAFTAHPTMPSFGAGESYDLALGDLDGDGDLDAVVANISPPAGTVWLNDGTGMFTAHPTAPAFGFSMALGVALGDLEGDGDLDAVVTDYGRAEEVWVNVTAPTLSIDDVTMAEGDAGTQDFTFTITRSGYVSIASSVDWSTADGSAVAPGDYATEGPTTVTFAAGETTKTVSVTVNGDTSVEANDGFTVNLSNPVGASIADGTGVGRITNDDAAAFSVDDVTVNEGDSGTTLATFTVSRTGDTGDAAAVQWRTLDAHAVAGGDYAAVPLTILSFAAGETTKNVSVSVTATPRSSPPRTSTSAC